MTLFPRRKTRGIPRAKSMDAFSRPWSNALETVLDLLDHGLQSGLPRRMRPVCADMPDWLIRDLSLRRPSAQHENVVMLSDHLRRIHHPAVWDAARVLRAMAPAPCLRMMRRACRVAVEEALLSDADASPPGIGPVSILSLITLNNMLCLHRRIQTSRLAGFPLIGVVFIRRDRYIRELQMEINRNVEEINEFRHERTAGDILFHHSIIPFLEDLRSYGYLAAYVDHLVTQSPWTALTRIADDRLWQNAHPEEITAVFSLLEQTGSIHLLERMAQLWVDALMSERGERQRQIFWRIDTLLAHLIRSTASPPSGCRIVFHFIRIFLRMEDRDLSPHFRPELLGAVTERMETWLNDLQERVASVSPDIVEPSLRRGIQRISISAHRGASETAVEP